MDVVAYGGSDIPTMKNYVKKENILVSVAKEWDQKMKKGFRKLTPKWSYYWFTTVSMVSFDYEKKTALIAEPNNRIELIGQSNWPEYNRIRYYEFARFPRTSLSSFLLFLIVLLVIWGRTQVGHCDFAFRISDWADFRRFCCLWLCSSLFGAELRFLLPLLVGAGIWKINEINLRCIQAELDA